MHRNRFRLNSCSLQRQRNHVHSSALPSMQKCDSNSQLGRLPEGIAHTHREHHRHGRTGIGMTTTFDFEPEYIMGESPREWLVRPHDDERHNFPEGISGVPPQLRMEEARKTIGRPKSRANCCCLPRAACTDISDCNHHLGFVLLSERRGRARANTTKRNASQNGEGAGKTQTSFTTRRRRRTQKESRAERKQEETTKELE